MLGKASIVSFKKAIPFETMVETLSREGFEPQYRKRVHPVISELGIRPEPFYMTELLANHGFPKTLTLVAQRRRAIYLLSLLEESDLAEKPAERRSHSRYPL